METVMTSLAQALSKRKYAVKTFKTAQEAKAHLLTVIEKDASVGIGGSMTVKQLGIEDELKARGNTVYWHWGAEDPSKMREAASTADVYLCSANAATKDGLLINIDGYGNRLAATLFGPKKVIMILGRNKICEDYDAAMEHIHNVACPANAKRLGLNTPCAVLGHCTDCSSPQRMCNAKVILERCPNSHPIEIYLVNEELGY